MSRVVVARAEGLHRRKAGNRTRRNGRFRTACQGCIEFAPLNHAVGIANGVGPRCAGRNDTGAVALKAEENGYLAGGHVGNHLRYDKGIDPGRALRKEAFI